MKLKSWLGAAALIAVLGAGGPASAQAQAPPPTEAAATPRAVELSKRYLQASGVTDAVVLMLDTLVPLLIEAETRRNPAITEAEKAAVSKIVQTAIVDVMPQYMELLAPEVAKIFTETELAAAVAFFESAEGRALVAKQGALTPAAERAMTSLLPQIQETVKVRLCDALGCGTSSARPTAS